MERRSHSSSIRAYWGGERWLVAPVWSSHTRPGVIDLLHGSPARWPTARECLPPYFADPPPVREHELLAHVAFSGGSRLFYGGFYGIWSYDLDAGTIAPVQLSIDKVTFSPDSLCVMPGANKLVYRDSQDATGRMYWIDIAALP